MQIEKQEKDNSNDLSISAIEHYIERQKIDKDSEFYQLKDFKYSKILINSVQETINVKATTADDKKYSGQFQVKEEQNAYYIINNGTIIFEYIPNINYIAELLCEYYEMEFGEDIEGVCYYKYNVGKQAEEIRLEYKDQKNM